jgi:hypothetical protein
VNKRILHVTPWKKKNKVALKPKTEAKKFFFPCDTSSAWRLAAKSGKADGSRIFALR